jgi:hypothetical protein
MDMPRARARRGLGNGILKLARPGRFGPGQSSHYGHKGHGKDDKYGFLTHAILLYDEYGQVASIWPDKSLSFFPE